VAVLCLSLAESNKNDLKITEKGKIQSSIKIKINQAAANSQTSTKATPHLRHHLLKANPIIVSLPTILPVQYN
jgi:hypothetical protein